MRIPIYRALVILCAALVPAGAHAVNMGVAIGASGGHSVVLPEGKEGGHYVPFLPRFSFFLDDLINDDRAPSYLDMDASFFVLGALGGSADLLGVSLDPLPDLVYPRQHDDKRKALGAGPLLRGRAVGLAFDLGGDFYAGASLGLDISSVMVIPADRLGSFGAFQTGYYGSFYIGPNVGVALGYRPLPELLLVLNPTVEVMILERDPYYGGWAAGGYLEALWDVVPDWVTLRAKVRSDYRDFERKRSLADESAAFFTHTFAFSVIVKFGALFGD